MDASKSCLKCPSFLTAEQGVSKFKKSIGSPVCGRYGIPLSKPGLSKQQGEKLAVHLANKCDSFGDPLPPVPVEARLSVALPDPKVFDPDPEESATAAGLARESCTTCAMCKNFVSDETVAVELGWTTGLCAAKGKLILPNKQVVEARNCEMRRFGVVRRSTAGIHLLPEYEDAFQINADPTRAYFRSRDAFVDPKDWETERDVTPEESANGIRAWRKIVDPAGTGNEVYLPIYRSDFFDEAEAAKIPQAGDDEHPELYVDHFGGLYTVGVLWTETDETPMMWGEAGVGKTELYRHVAWLMQLPFERFSITGQTELDDLAGKMKYHPEKGTYFQYGRLVQAWRKPNVICLDEPNTGPAEVWQFLRPLTDNSKQLVLDQNNGERIARHTDCYLGMAANPAWDPKNVGAMEIGDADASRLIHVYVELPPVILEREIIANRVKLDGWEISVEQLDTLMNVAEELRALVRDGTLPITWGIRPQLKVARALRWFDWTTAYRRAIGDFLEPEVQESLLDVVKSHVH